MRVFDPAGLYNTSHTVLFGQGSTEHSRKFVSLGIRTLGLVNLKILKCCDLLSSRHCSARVTLTLPSTQGVVPEPRWVWGETKLVDDADVFASNRNKGPQLEDVLEGCFFQLNYSRSARDTAARPSLEHGDAAEMSALEQAVCSEHAKGYEERRLMRLFTATAERTRRCMYTVYTDEPSAAELRTSIEPLYTTAWLGPVKTNRAVEADTTIGDGEFFPKVAVAGDCELEEEDEDSVLSCPLAEYKLHLTVKSSPNPMCVFRADRSPGECGSVYEACVDEAVLLGHCARLRGTGGAKKNFDVSACLTWFYKSVHPCVLDIEVGQIVLDYEFDIHGRGDIPPVYGILSHLAESCRVNSFSDYKLVTISRHRSASVWTRGTDQPFHTRPVRANSIGAFLCAQDHRLAPLLARCCDPEPLDPGELQLGSPLLPRGDEAELLLLAYSGTLGPVYTFERVRDSPGRVKTSLGNWSFMKLETKTDKASRRPGTSVIDGHTVAFAAESPLFYLKGRGPLVHKLESVAVIVESSSFYRTDVRQTEKPEWPEPHPIATGDRIKCRPKGVVLDEMFVREGPRDPLESYTATEGASWKFLTTLIWSYRKAPPSRDWECDCPTTASLTTIGRSTGPGVTKWMCLAPPKRLMLSCTRDSAQRRRTLEIQGLESDHRTAARQDPEAWRGFLAMCSRVLVCPAERLWSRGLCRVSNSPLSVFSAKAIVPMANLIVIVNPGQWCASPAAAASAEDRGDLPEWRPGYHPVDGDNFGATYAEVCSATEFAAALGQRMLSDRAHEDLEIRCCRPGLYEYIQRALVWFAGATGPFRSRSVTVFTPDVEHESAVPWAYSLPENLDVLKTKRSVYLVSCSTGRPDLIEAISSSSGVVFVSARGNLVLHDSEKSCSLAVLKKDPGFHAVAIFGASEHRNDRSDDDRPVLYVRCKASVKDFCKMHDLPKGIRGPETWKKTPWLKGDSGTFCRNVARIKYRWETGRSADRHEAMCSSTSTPAETVVRGPDGELFRSKERVWNAIDSVKSLLRSERTRASPSHSAIDHLQQMWSPVDLDDPESLDPSDSLDDGDDDDASDTETVGTADSLVVLESRWHESGPSCFLTLNSRLRIEFTAAEPPVEGHVVLRSTSSEAAYPKKVELSTDGRVVKYYKHCSFSELTKDLCTVFTFGCGLRPLLYYDKEDIIGTRFVYLAIAAVAGADKLPSSVKPARMKLTVVVREGRNRMVEIARSITGHTLVPRRNRMPAYTFRRLPEAVSEAAGGSDGPFDCGPFAYPDAFAGKHGAQLFAELSRLYPALLNRKDIRHPACSKDPRWIGLMLFLSEWQEQYPVANLLAAGALESLEKTTAAVAQAQAKMPRS